jgi:Fur family ferric uptake transcriptional regulator/Fur family peroxide stress response transcriptional regulator
MPRPRLYRDAILDLLRRNPIHPTVDWLHRELRKTEPRVSLTTVYRTLRVLVAEGILCELPFGPGESRFGLVKEQNHYHFICEVCGQIRDLSITPGSGMEDRVSKATGHRVVRHTTEFFGTCKSCLERSGRPAKPRKATLSRGGRGAPRPPKGKGEAR